MVKDFIAALPDEPLRAVALIAQRAAELIVAMRAQGITVTQKADKSPVTDADIAAQKLIDEQLPAVLPCAIIGEENSHHRAGMEKFWLVDPIDGTRDFIKGRDCFTVNIALIENAVPTWGVVVAPLYEGGVFYAGKKNVGAFVSRGGAPFVPMAVRAPPKEGLTAAISHWQRDDEALQDYLKSQRVIEQKAIGSSLKFGWLAEGRVDIYPRLTPTMEWDSGAGDAVIRAAGGMVYDMHGKDMPYGKENYRNEGFVARGARQP